VPSGDEEGLNRSPLSSKQTALRSLKYESPSFLKRPFVDITTVRGGSQPRPACHLHALLLFAPFAFYTHICNRLRSLPRSIPVTVASISIHQKK